ncbi:MAG: hypothetical protein Q8K98_10910 [Bacteroidota bacterium]|nr:hypothetical protein [Bacteroidota bacterium]
MQKLISIFILLLLPLYLFCDDENEYVQVYTSVKPATIKAGGNAEILFTFATQEGIHINLDPPIEVEIDKKFAALSKLDVPKAKGSEYLNLKKPVKQSFTLNKKLKPGKHQLKGTLTYFYCSDEEGWCSRFQQTIQLNIVVEK